jgi:hypothetical protein
MLGLQALTATSSPNVILFSKKYNFIYNNIYAIYIYYIYRLT